MFTLDTKNTVIVTTEIDPDGDITISFDGEAVGYIDQNTGALELFYFHEEDRAPLAAKGVAFTDSGRWQVNA